MSFLSQGPGAMFGRVLAPVGGLEIEVGDTPGGAGTVTLRNASLTPRLIMTQDASGGNYPCIRMPDAMGAGESHTVSQTWTGTLNNGILSESAGSFELGTSGIVDGTSLFYLTLGDEGFGTLWNAGSYTGAGGARSVTTGFSTDIVWLFSSSGDIDHWRSSARPETNTWGNGSSIGDITLTATGFDVPASLDASGTEYFWAAWSDDSALAEYIGVETYTGNGNVRDIPVTANNGRTIQYAMTSEAFGGYSVLRATADNGEGHQGATSTPANNFGASTTAITALSASAITLGTDGQVNWPSSSYSALWISDST